MKIFAILAAFITIQCTAQTSAAIDTYIDTYESLAIEEQLRTGIPAAITMAQAIHESGAGVGELALKSNNHFGIKCKSTWTGDKVYHDDDESGECFRSYTCVADSYKDHSDFLKANKRYEFLFELSPEDYSAWAKGLKRAGYATNPKYPEILIRIIEENGLADLTVEAQQKNSDGNVWIPTSTIAETPIQTPQATKDNNNTQSETKPVVLKAVSEKKTVEQSAPTKQGIFKINHCKAIFAENGTSLKTLARQYGISVEDLLDFNDMRPKDKLADNQIIFLEEKRKKGNTKTHQVQKNETSWSISQKEGIKLEHLLEYNRMSRTAKLKTGQLLYLKHKAPK